MERYDIAIIGTGPAGLSAAVTATVRNKKVLLLGNKNLSDKVGKAHDIQNYLGLPDVSGENLAKAFQSHLDHPGQGQRHLPHGGVLFHPVSQRQL